ncbi:MAG: SulP family inorganic anion transporter [Bacteroidota bacterium]
MIRSLFPILGHLKGYDRETLQGDLSAGLTVGVMLIPQGMAYALIAGLPPIYGLYASLVPLALYAFFGTSRQLSVAPVAMVSLLVAAGVAPLAGGNMELYIGLALLLSLMVGVLQFGLGLARFGFLANFLSHPVLAGFTSAAALIIGFSQLKHLLGIDIGRSHHVHEILWQAMQQIGSINPVTFIIGLGSIAVLMILRSRAPRLPGALVVVAVSTVGVWLLDLTAYGVSIVGNVPKGLPAPTLPAFGMENISALVPAALTIGLVGFMESIAVAKVYASKHGYEVDANRELTGLGLANIAGAFFQAYPTTGGFSRTAVNDQAGARTTVASLISAGIIAVTLLFLTGLFYYLPQAVLAAIVMVAVFKLIDWKEARYLWSVDRKDFGLMMVTFIATLGLGIEQGILVGVVASLVVVIYQTSRPHTAVMGRLPGTDTFRNLKRHPKALTTSGIVVFRMDAALFFANAMHFKDRLREIEQQDAALRALVLDFYPVNRIDSTGVHTLKEIVEGAVERGIAVYMAGVKGPVMDVFQRAGIDRLITSDRFFMEVRDAVEQAEADTSVRPSRPDAHMLTLA